MNNIPISETNILWNSGLNGETPSFAIRPLGHPDCYEYQYRVGACFKAWRESNLEEQKLRLMIDIWHITCFYEVPSEIMKDELLRIPEYRDMLADDCLPQGFQNERD